MGVSEGRAQLDKAMKELRLRWLEAHAQWNDAVSKEFEDKYIAPLELDHHSATSAMDHMAILLGQAQRDCS
jgi:hypothetical protein